MAEQWPARSEEKISLHGAVGRKLDYHKCKFDFDEFEKELTQSNQIIGFNDTNERMTMI